VGCEADDVQSLAAAMTRIANDDLAAAKMSVSAFEKARLLAPTPQEWGDDLILMYQSKLAD
jgi:hypothetical protein